MRGSSIFVIGCDHESIYKTFSQYMSLFEDEFNMIKKNVITGIRSKKPFPNRIRK